VKRALRAVSGGRQGGGVLGAFASLLRRGGLRLCVSRGRRSVEARNGSIEVSEGGTEMVLEWIMPMRRGG